MVEVTAVSNSCSNSKSVQAEKEVMGRHCSRNIASCKNTIVNLQKYVKNELKIYHGIDLQSNQYQNKSLWFEKNLLNRWPWNFLAHSLKTLSSISPSITKDRHWVQNKLHLLWILIFDATFFNVIMIFTILQVCVHFHIQYSSSISSLNSRAFMGWQCKH